MRRLTSSAREAFWESANRKMCLRNPMRVFRISRCWWMLSPKRIQRFCLSMYRPCFPCKRRKAAALWFRICLALLPERICSFPCEYSIPHRKKRDKLYSYFSELVTIRGSTEIRIPLDWQQLADYLGVERTALSKELGKNETGRLAGLS